jgi:very-short-patch-repair endonuclease
MNKGHKHTEEFKQRLRERNIGNKHGLGNKWNLGRKFSEEHKRKIGLRSLGNRNMFGKKHTEETKGKMSISKLGNKNSLGRKLSEETKRKMTQSRLGFKHSEETKHKMSLSAMGNKRNLGNKHSEKTKEKMYQTARLRFLRTGQRLNIGKNEKTLLDKQEQIDDCEILRQYHIKHLGYIVDGYCPETNTVYEVYEKHHLNQIEHDIKRQQLIQESMKCIFIIIWDNVQVVPMESKEN